MWQRFLRLLTTGLNIYSFYANPLRYILSLLAVILIPYLIYIFWGSLVIIALSALGIYFLFRAILSGKQRTYT